MKDLDKFIKRKLEEFHFDGSPRNSWLRMQHILRSQVREGAIPALIKQYGRVLIMPMLLVCAYYLGTRKQIFEHATENISIAEGDLDGGGRQEVINDIILQGSDGKLYTIETQDWKDIGSHEFLCVTPYKDTSLRKKKDKHQASPIHIIPFSKRYPLPPKSGEKNGQITLPSE